jgi:hypothetical protein
MNTRFEVPLTLPPPHFDDERTIATARQVKPIGRARVTQSWSRIRTVLPLLLLATFCGGLGAAAVNYYERRSNPQVARAPVFQTSAQPTPAHVEPSPVAIAASNEVNGSKPPIEEKTVEVEQPAAPAPKHEDQPDPIANSTPNETLPAAPKPQNKNAADADAAKLTRKRRVQPVEEKSRAQKSGAARISDIFSGPNP